MSRETANLIITRALAFVSTLGFSLAMVNSQPQIKAQRQSYFAQAAIDLVWMQQAMSVDAVDDGLKDWLVNLWIDEQGREIRGARARRVEGRQVEHIGYDRYSA